MTVKLTDRYGDAGPSVEIQIRKLWDGDIEIVARRDEEFATIGWLTQNGDLILSRAHADELREFGFQVTNQGYIKVFYDGV